MNAYLLMKPVVTEKSLRLANEQNTYTFRVATNASKPQIASAVRMLYGVEVVKVRTIANQAVARRTGKKRLTSQTKKAKKALVTIKTGQKIDIFDLGK